MSTDLKFCFSLFDSYSNVLAGRSSNWNGPYKPVLYNCCQQPPCRNLCTLYKNFGINVPILTCFVCSQKIPTPHPPVLYSVFGWNWTAQIFFGVCVTPLVLLSINTMKQLVQCPSIPILSNCFPQVCHIVGEGLAEGRFYLRNIRDQTLGETTPYQNFKVSCQTMNI